MTARRGRPPLPPGEQRTHMVRVLVTPAEAAELEAWAQREEQSLSAAARERLLRAARRAT